MVTENGHIVKTIGLQTTNLAGMSMATFLPTQRPLHNILFLTIGLSKYRYGFPAKVQRSRQGKETVITPISSTSTDVYTEVVTFTKLRKKRREHNTG